MLKTPAAFPFPGSYALFIDDSLPAAQQRAELVRIIRLGVSTATVAFPLRPDVASGHRTVAQADLIDATPLTKTEEREMHDAQRGLVGAKEGGKLYKRLHAIFAAHRARAMAAIILASEKAKFDERQSRQLRRIGGSIGQAVAA